MSVAASESKKPRRKHQKTPYKSKVFDFRAEIEEDEQFVTIDGVKIYSGITDERQRIYEERIRYLQDQKEMRTIFTPLEPSTLTAIGRMSNVSLMEKDFIKQVKVPEGNIQKICCNYGKVVNPRYKSPVVVKQSRRGRKPKNKQPKKRKAQGTGEYFNSQVTFYITDARGTMYIIKLFRNGVFQVPGVRSPNMTDLVGPASNLRDFLREHYGRNDIEIMNFRAFMRNYKCRIVESDHFRVYLNRLEQFVTMEKNNDANRQFINYFCGRITDSAIREDMLRGIGNYNPMNIAEIGYNVDRRSSLDVRFYRPTKNDPNKKITVKLVKSGKINFDGGISEQEIVEIYHWFDLLYMRHRLDILCDITKIVDAASDNDDDFDCKSIYDDDVVIVPDEEKFVIRKREIPKFAPRSHKETHAMLSNMFGDKQ